MKPLFLILWAGLLIASQAHAKGPQILPPCTEIENPRPYPAKRANCFPVVEIVREEAELESLD